VILVGGCGQSKIERDAEYFHKHHMNYDQYQNFMADQKQQWVKEYKSSEIYFPRQQKKSTK
jgi:hypothetical protein